MTPCPQKEGIRLITAFLHGYILALGLILPLGPQNVFVFNQGAAHRDFVRALPVVLAASCSDTLLILAAVMGVSLMVLTFAWVKLALASVGVVFLLLVGWNTWRTRPAAA
jgi:L-lysine exporter family protein LysE/ArgO